MKYTVPSSLVRIEAALLNALIVVVFLWIGISVSPFRLFSPDAFEAVFWFMSMLSWEQVLLATVEIWSPLVLLACIQIYLISKRGQSLGKILLKIKIVNYGDNKDGDFYRNVLVREIFFKLLVVLSCGLLALVDFLALLVSKNHRTIHDKIACTVVVDCNKDGVPVKRSKKENKIWPYFEKYLFLFWPVILATIFAVLYLYIPEYTGIGIVDFFHDLPEAVLYRFRLLCNPDYIFCLSSNFSDGIINNSVMTFGLQWVCFAVYIIGGFIGAGLWSLAVFGYKKLIKKS